MPHRTRNRYRIRYPRRERPVLRVGEAGWEVIDLSETGLRCRLPADARAPVVGTEVEGVIGFRQGSEIPIVGAVVRVSARPNGCRDVALRYAEGDVPFSVILDEQKYLRAHYPCW